MSTPTPEQIEAAAERLEHYLKTGGGDPYDIEPDMRTLANAYLSDRASRKAREAEEAKPVTEEWLESVGFTIRRRRDLAGQYTISSLRSRNMHVEILPPPDHMSHWEVCVNDEQCYVRQSLTRGDVIHLCAALGIELPEGDQE